MIVWRELQPEDPGRIGPYRLCGLLGSGGMGRVFLGVTADGQQAAVKVIHVDLGTDPEFRARFRREVTVARKVSSRFTAPLIDADVDGAVPWLATAYVTGPSLADAVAQRAAARGLGAGTGRRARRGPECDSRRRGHPPRPEAIQRAAGPRRAAGHRGQSGPGARRGPRPDPALPGQGTRPAAHGPRSDVRRRGGRDLADRALGARVGYPHVRRAPRPAGPVHDRHLRQTVPGPGARPRPIPEPISEPAREPIPEPAPEPIPEPAPSGSPAAAGSAAATPAAS